MSALLRAGFVALVVAVATLGEGGGAASSLLASHLLLAIAVATCAFSFDRSSYTPSPGPVSAWLCFVILAATGAYFAPYAYAAWLVLVELLAFGSLFWLASGDPPVSARILAPAVAALSTAHGLAALVQRAAGSHRPASSFLNPNHLAAWLAAAVLFVAGAMLARDASRAIRSAYGVAIAVALAGIVLTGSRGAFVGLAAGAAVLVAVFFRSLSGRARRAMMAGAAVLVLAGGLGVVLRFRSDDDPHRFRRTEIWSASFRGAVGSPLFGVGPGQFAAAAPNLNFPLTDAPLRFERGFRTPHSDVLRAVCEFGFPAAAAAFAAVALAAWELFRRRDSLTAIERGAVAALVGLGAQSLVDDLTTRPALVMLGAAFAGLLLARRRTIPVSRVTRLAAVLAAVLIAAALGVGEVAGYLAWSAARDLPRGHLQPAQLARLHRSLAWNPMQPATWQRLSEHFVGDGRSWSLSDYAAAREAAERAIRLQPVDAFFARAAARVEATAALSILPFEATRDRAARHYEDAMRLARTDATIPLEAAKFLLLAGDPGGAERAATQSIAIEPRAVAPRVYLARAIQLKGGPGGAIRAGHVLDEALALAPKAGETPQSSYEAALRSVDPQLVEVLRRELSQGGAQN